ncbi:asparagine synthase-related protein [Sphingomonas sp. Sphisp140]|uniref:asparagine synthase-related protein n=1 Tax=unclassified Sphingomonas TaxID=196159 RepID=UPI0039AFC47D
MRPRYLVLLSAGADLAEAAERIAGRTGLRLARSAPRFAVLVSDACRCLEVDPQGVVIGTLFHRHGPARVIETLGEAERSALAQEGHDALLRSFWGGYVAVRARGDELQILRDPSGALPCYRGVAGDLAMLASDVELLEMAGCAPGGVAWDRLGRILYSCGLPIVETALGGITTLLPGTGVALRGRSERSLPGWSPWDFVAPCAGEESFATAERLRRVVEQCVAAWASLYRHPLVSLSGGLDSSIVTASLARSGSSATCITMFTDDVAGDERGFAQAVSSSLALPLVERRYDLDAVDLGHALGAHLPRPLGRAEAQPYEKAHRETAAAIGADAFFTGNGGDNVFGFSQSAAALADRALHEGPGAGAFATLRDICRQTGAGPLRVTRAAVAIARRPAAYPWKPSPAFLHPDLIASLRGLELSHPWLEAPPWALPGKAAHIAGIARAHPTLESDRSRFAPVINPLLSQPVIEACLAIPSWQWREGGRDRSMARAAFADRLPPVIVERRVKGSPDPFCGEIIRRRGKELRERLMNGLLARHRILDTRAIEEALRPDRLTAGEENARLLELINVEAWATAWSSRSIGTTVAGPGTT